MKRLQEHVDHPAYLVQQIPVIVIDVDVFRLTRKLVIVLLGHIIFIVLGSLLVCIWLVCFCLRNIDLWTGAPYYSVSLSIFRFYFYLSEAVPLNFMAGLSGRSYFDFGQLFETHRFFSAKEPNFSLADHLAESVILDYAEQVVIKVCNDDQG